MGRGWKRLVSLLPAAIVAGAACSAFAQSGQLNVRNFGASGDGTQDDCVKAIPAAVAAAKRVTGAVLVFPAGTYVCRTAGRHGVDLGAGASNLTIRFEAGATLVMDNMRNGRATGDGIRLLGPATQIRLENVRIRWAQPHAGEAAFQGINADNDAAAQAIADYDRDTDSRIAATQIAGLSITGCEISRAPQVGIVAAGVTGLTIRGCRITDTLADGMMLDHVRNCTIADNELRATGDDAIGLHRPVNASQLRRARVGLGADGRSYGWDGGCTVSGNRIIGQNTGPAARKAGAGLAVYGGRNITFSDNVVEGKARGFQSFFGPYNQHYGHLVSRGIVVRGLTVTGVSNVLRFSSMGNNATSPPDLWRGDYRISGVRATGNAANGVFVDDTVSGTGLAAGIVVDGYTESGSTGGGAAFWHVQRCQGCSFRNTRSDQREVPRL